MRLQKVKIKHFRSIEDVDIYFPEKTPIVLFGPNNAGKSNILHAIEILLGERWPGSYEFQDSDYYFRDKDGYPHIELYAAFDENIYEGNFNSDPSRYLAFKTNIEKGDHAFIYLKDSNRKMYVKKEDREKCQLILIDATRDMTRQLSYYSQYSMLSRMSKRMHQALVEKQKEKLDDYFKKLTNVYKTVTEYKRFIRNLKKNFDQNIDGFLHRLEIDLSSFDPNNYFNGLRIIAKEGEDSRSFEEFGTGEQQILLMAFMNAYAMTFTNENFVLAIEEPEAHLHPLAQQWLARNLAKNAKQGMQVIISTHSPYFLNINNLEGFIRVYKEDGVTKTVQLSKEAYYQKCIDLRANAERTKPENIIQYYSSNTFSDHCSGFFSEKILLVEGESEYFAIPTYFELNNYPMDQKGIQIINCRGKAQIPRLYRLFKSFNYRCFAIFDADESRTSNEEIIETFNVNEDLIILDESRFEVLSDELVFRLFLVA
jgi:putative ATP-dependent endonuclease of OLD family